MAMFPVGATSAVSYGTHLEFENTSQLVEMCLPKTHSEKRVRVLVTKTQAACQLKDRSKQTLNRSRSSASSEKIAQAETEYCSVLVKWY